MTLTDWGLTLNIVGTLMVAFSFGKLPKGFGGTTTSDKGKIYAFAYLVRPNFFYSGIILLVLGYLIQLGI